MKKQSFKEWREQRGWYRVGRKLSKVGRQNVNLILWSNGVETLNSLELLKIYNL